jgi:branched-chain amino acid transport system permease protein
MDYLYGIVIIVGLYVILASSFNLIIGYGGLVSIAHPVFFALGAYASAILSRDYGVPVLGAMLAGMLVAVVASIALALPALRVSGDYLMIASIGFQLGILEVIKNFRFTGGPGGFTNIPPFLIRDFGRESYVLLVLIVMFGVIALVWWISRSDYGRAMSAMRDDELAFSSIGRDAKWMKIAIFGLGSGIAGFAGALYAHYFRYIAPEQFEILQSSAILTMVVVGGLRTTWGPVVGALLLQALPQALTFLNLPPSILGPIQGLLFTGLVLVFMFFRPQGLVPANDIWRAVRPASAGAPRPPTEPG